MKLRYCRHCKKDVPMFNDEEYQQLSEVHRRCIGEIKMYRQTYMTTLSETPLDELYKPLSIAYQKLTGVEMLFNAEEVMQRHYLSRWKEYKQEAA